MQAGNPRLLFAGITIYSFSRGIYTWVWFVCLFVCLGHKTSGFYNCNYQNQFRSFIKYDPAPLPGLLGNRLLSWINIKKSWERCPSQFSNLLTYHLNCAPPAWHISGLTGLG